MSDVLWYIILEHLYLSPFHFWTVVMDSTRSSILRL